MSALSIYIFFGYQCYVNKFHTEASKHHKA